MAEVRVRLVWHPINRSRMCLKLIESLIVQEDTIVDAAD